MSSGRQASSKAIQTKGGTSKVESSEFLSQAILNGFNTGKSSKKVNSTFSAARLALSQAMLLRVGGRFRTGHCLTFTDVGGRCAICQVRSRSTFLMLATP